MSSANSIVNMGSKICLFSRLMLFSKSRNPEPPSPGYLRDMSASPVVHTVPLSLSIKEADSVKVSQAMKEKASLFLHVSLRPRIQQSPRKQSNYY